MSFIIDKYADARVLRGWIIPSIVCMRVLFFFRWKPLQMKTLAVPRRLQSFRLISIAFPITLERMIIFHKLCIHRSNGFDLNETFMRHSKSIHCGEDGFCVGLDVATLSAWHAYKAKAEECCTKCKWQLKNCFTWLSDSESYDNKNKHI
jgi:hypothetical protein